MPLPDFIRAFPALDLPFPADQVSTNAIRSDAGLVVFFSFHKDMEVPAHAHRGQWGMVIEGMLELTIEGEARRYGPGESYAIPSGARHSARAKAGSRVVDVFEEPDRYPLKG